MSNNKRTGRNIILYLPLFLKRLYGTYFILFIIIIVIALGGYLLKKKDRYYNNMFHVDKNNLFFFTWCTQNKILLKKKTIKYFTRLIKSYRYCVVCAVLAYTQRTAAICFNFFCWNFSKKFPKDYCYAYYVTIHYFSVNFELRNAQNNTRFMWYFTNCCWKCCSRLHTTLVLLWKKNNLRFGNKRFLTQCVLYHL